MFLRQLPRFRQAYRALEALERREAWSRTEIETFQVERLNRVWAAATSHVPYYQRLAAEQRLPRAFRSLADMCAVVPVLPAGSVRESAQDFLSEQPRAGAWYRTSGSTGHPGRVFCEHEAHLEILRARYRFLASWGQDIFDPSVMLWSSRELSTGRGLLDALGERIGDRLRRRLRLSAASLSDADLERHLRAIERFRPAVLYGYSVAVELLARMAERRQFSGDSLRLVILTGEPARPQAVAAIERAFRVPAVMEYGATECEFIAGESRDRIMRVREDHVLLETVPRHDGRYDILLTVLGNASFPLFRYATGDLTDAPLTRPARGFAQIAGIAGRSDDLLMTRRGSWVHPTRVDDVFESPECRTIRRYRVHQRLDGSLVVTVEALSPDQPIDPARLAARLSQVVDGYPVEVSVVDALPSIGRGKHRVTTSEISYRRWRSAAG